MIQEDWSNTDNTDNTDITDITDNTDITTDTDASTIHKKAQTSRTVHTVLIGLILFLVTISTITILVDSIVAYNGIVYIIPEIERVFSDVSQDINDFKKILLNMSSNFDQITKDMDIIVKTINGV